MATPRKKNPQKGGRKTLYKKEFDDLAHGYALLGLTDSQMAKYFGVSDKTFDNWKKKYPSFLRSINSGKEPADAEVARSLIDRAKGYEWDEEVPIKVKEVTYNNGKRVREVETVVMKTVHRVVPPDTRAIQYWMNNRRRKRLEPAEGEEPDNSWAERHEIDHTSKGEKVAVPLVYLPQDLPTSVVGDVDDSAGEIS